MRARAILLAATALLAVGLIAGVANATPNQKVDLFQDGGAAGGAIDMAGPTGYGFVNYNTNASGALRIVVGLKNAQPNTTYTIFLVCGPTHATACGFIDIGSVTTDDDGNATSGAIWIEDPPYAGGPDDHLDLIGGGEVYAATPLTT